ncbi:DNA/RNA non-specific endonuclease [Companilactobacillus sp. DQM5]|uniref:DNA/RNA non-specific endonuclease n=1 Tax=Companilactobacillus sp. DQM5 TaxID=3463359 RepID=UPI004058F6C0
MSKYRRKSKNYTPTTALIIIVVALISFFINRPTENGQKPHNNSNYELATGNKNINTDNEYSELSSLNYDNKQELVINNNNPNFSDAELSLKNGAWQSFGNLDSLGRSTIANAMLNKSIMPTTKRKPLYVNPTGFHNKEVNGEYVYNRSHLIGYQLTGQNNNLRNLMTGTRSLNSPGMNKYEMDIAQFLKQNPDKYVRYQVRPVYRGDELVARGVQIKAQSIGSNEVHLNVYIFNIEKDAKIDYATGYIN